MVALFMFIGQQLLLSFFLGGGGGGQVVSVIFIGQILEYIIKLKNRRMFLPGNGVSY